MKLVLNVYYGTQAAILLLAIAWWFVQRSKAKTAKLATK